MAASSLTPYSGGNDCTMSSFSEFKNLFMQYIQEVDPSSAAAVTARQQLDEYIPFQFIMCKWNCLPHRFINILARKIVNEIWSPDHRLIHRLREIGHYAMLAVVFKEYLRKSLARDNSQLQILRSLPLQRFVHYCLQNYQTTKHVTCLGFEDIQQSERDRVQQLANCCTCPQLQQMVVVFAALVADWSLVLHELRVRSFPSNFISELYIWLAFARKVPPVVINQMLQKKSSDRRLEDSLRRHFFQGESDATKDRLVLSFLSNVRRNATLCAVNQFHWPLAGQLFPGCSDKSVLFALLIKSANERKMEIPTEILRFLAHSSEHPILLSIFILPIVCEITKEDVVEKLLKWCAVLGLTTYWRFSLCQLKTDSFRKIPVSVIKLVLTTGMVTYTDCLRYVQRPGSTADNSQQFEEKMQAEGTRPLWEVCRLTISHRIGYHPGRPQRINALPYPDSLKRLVRFSDLRLSWEDFQLDMQM